MEPAKRVYTVSHKRQHKMFRIPADLVEVGNYYACEETPDGVRFTLCEGAPYKVVGEANNANGIPRYGTISFSDDDWDFGDKYTVEGFEGGVNIVRVLSGS